MEYDQLKADMKPFCVFFSFYVETDNKKAVLTHLLELLAFYKLKCQYSQRENLDEEDQPEGYEMRFLVTKGQLSSHLSIVRLRQILLYDLQISQQHHYIFDVEFQVRS